ncbi:MAG TPA: hypothetical protein VL651_11970 [Bacteroidia bacterium]|jgi:hypothetical protein|nr:hypothetical protein [Bacteroidia bacterium]
MKNSLFILPVILFLFASCNSDAPKKENPPAAPAVIADSLFAFHNIRNTEFVKHFWYDEAHDFQPYADSTKKIKLVKMDSVMKKKILVPLMDIDASYIVQYMDAIFISKQDSMGPYTPIIVRLSGDDYDEVMMILLNSKCEPVSRLSLYGGDCGGPDEIGDSLSLNCPYKQTYFDGTKISSYVLHVYDHTRHEDWPSVIDSVTYETSINPNGQFITVEKDSTRYRRKFDWGW